MKKLNILAVLLLLTIQIQAANYVDIPDTNFRNVLKIKFRDCFNSAGQIDTECSAVINATSLEISFNKMKNLEGIQYFVNITKLECAFNDIIVIPEFPKLIKELSCYGNKLTSLPDLPLDLEKLDFGLMDIY